MSEIDFEIGEPIRSVAFKHSTPNTSQLWIQAFNASTDEEAIEKAMKAFEEGGLNVARIYETEVTPLILIDDIPEEEGREEESNGE